MLGKLWKVFVSVLLVMPVYSVDYDQKDTGKSMREIVEQHGYIFETHEIKTEDGYICELHRIKQEGQPPVLMQHGLNQASSMWITNSFE
jgi:hypothetical protein